MSDLPDKLYYSIREVSEHTGVEPHVLRYWESEFPSLKPRRSRAGSRTYRKRDIEEILKIRALLHEEGYRIDGARKALREDQKTGGKKAKRDQIAMPFQDLGRPEKVARLKKEVAEILQLIQELKHPDAAPAVEKPKKPSRAKEARS